MAALMFSFRILAALFFTAVTAADTKPHIVFVLVDDWGWANVGYHRDPPTKEVVTPNIDGLLKGRTRTQPTLCLPVLLSFTIITTKWTTSDTCQ